MEAVVKEVDSLDTVVVEMEVKVCLETPAWTSVGLVVPCVS